jgi:CheY-like chemotaxis protein
VRARTDATSGGFDVRTATGGREALAAPEWWRPDVILPDLTMPEMDGRALRRVPEIADVPVVVLSEVCPAWAQGGGGVAEAPRP